MGIVTLASSYHVCSGQDPNSPRDETPTGPRQLGLWPVLLHPCPGQRDGQELGHYPHTPEGLAAL